jgi:uncharacterized heparinase superfamily protein
VVELIFGHIRDMPAIFGDDAAISFCGIVDDRIHGFKVAGVTWSNHGISP